MRCECTSKTTGVVTVSTGLTIYTTYCPLSSSVTIPVPPTTEETTPANTESTGVETQPTTEQTTPATTESTGVETQPTTEQTTPATTKETSVTSSLTPELSVASTVNVESVETVATCPEGGCAESRQPTQLFLLGLVLKLVLLFRQPLHWKNIL